jgi:peroxiredoxin
MKELGQLQAHHEDFAKRNTQVVAVSLDNLEDARKTQDRFPGLVIVSDKDESLAHAAELIAPQRSHEGGDTLAPTTVILDRGGVVRWVSRKSTVVERPPPEEVLKALDENVRGG